MQVSSLTFICCPSIFICRFHPHATQKLPFLFGVHLLLIYGLLMPSLAARRVQPWMCLEFCSESSTFKKIEQDLLEIQSNKDLLRLVPLYGWLCVKDQQCCKFRDV